MDRHYLVYILYSLTVDKYYVGFTSNDIIERVRKHNTNHKGFTGGKGDWSLVFIEIYNEKTIAMKREKQIKNWKSRKMIELLIKQVGSVHPDL